MNGRQKSNEKRETRNESRPNTCYALLVTRYSLLIVFLLLSFVSISNASWFNKTSGISDNMYRVRMFDGLNGFAVSTGTNQTLHKTTDGGNSWSTVLFMPSSTEVWDISLVSATRGFISYFTQKGVLEFNTSPSSLTMAGTLAAGSSGLAKIDARDLNTIYAIGLPNSSSGTPFNFSKSINGGSSWSDTLLGSAVLYLKSMSFSSDNLGWATGSIFAGSKTREIYKIENGTPSGTPSYTESVSSAPTISSIHALNQNNIWTIWMDGKSVYTNNGGTSWTSTTVVSTTDSFAACSIRFLNSNVGWATLYSLTNSSLSGIYRTVDGGQTWTLNKAGNFRDIDVLPGTSKLIVVGQSGAVAVLEPPDIASLSKTQIKQSTAEAVTIMGTGFDAPTLTFSKAGITYDALSVVSSTEITLNLYVSSTAEVGSVDLTLTNIDTTATTESSALVIGSGEAGMAITSVVPGSAYPGETVRFAINGTNIPNTIYSGSTDVNLGLGISAQFVTFETSGIITAIATIDASAAAGSRDIIITVKDSSGTTVAQAAKTAAFTVNASPEPGALPDSQSILPKIGNSGVWNPAKDGNLPVQVKVPAAGSYNIMVANESGIMYKIIKDLNIGYNTVVIPSSTEFSNGVHVLIFQDPKTGKTVKAKFAVNQ